MREKIKELDNLSVNFASLAIKALEKGDKATARDYNRRLTIASARSCAIEALQHIEAFLSDVNNHEHLHKAIDILRQIERLLSVPSLG